MFTLKDKIGDSANGFWLQVRNEDELSFVLIQLISRGFRGKLVSVERVIQKPSGEERLFVIFTIANDLKSHINRYGPYYEIEREKLEEAKKALTSRRNKARYEEKKRLFAGP